MRVASLLCGLLWLLTGCASDPMGMTTRAEIRANTHIQAERVKAENERLAREAEAQALIDVEIARQKGLTQRNANVVMIVPFVVLIIIAGGIVAMIVYWRGKIALEQAQMIGPSNSRPVLPKAWRFELAKRGCSAVYDNGDWYIVLPTGVRLDKPIEQRMLDIR